MGTAPEPELYSSGPTAAPNDGNADASYAVQIYVCAVLTWAITAAFVAARFYTRGRLLRVLGPEDWVILLSLVCLSDASLARIDPLCVGPGVNLANADLRKIFAGAQNAGTMQRECLKVPVHVLRRA